MLSPSQREFLQALNMMMVEMMPGRVHKLESIPEVGILVVTNYYEERSVPYPRVPISDNELEHRITLNITIYPEPPIDGTAQEVYTMKEITE